MPDEILNNELPEVIPQEPVKRYSLEEKIKDPLDESGQSYTTRRIHLLIDWEDLENIPNILYYELHEDNDSLPDIGAVNTLYIIKKENTIKRFDPTGGYISIGGSGGGVSFDIKTVGDDIITLELEDTITTKTIKAYHKKINSSIDVGNAEDVTITQSGEFVVPNIQTDEYGHITKSETKKVSITMPDVSEVIKGIGEINSVPRFIGDRQIEGTDIDIINTFYNDDNNNPVATTSLTYSEDDKGLLGNVNRRWHEIHGVKGYFDTVHENNVALKDKYLGINDKAVDSDLLDGKHGEYYLDYNNFTNTPTIPNPEDYYWADMKVSGVSNSNTTPRFKHMRAGNTRYNVASITTSKTIEELILHTGIRWVDNVLMPSLHFYGYAYGLDSPVEFKLAFHLYQNHLIRAGVTNMGAWKPEIYGFKETRDGIDYIAFGFKSQCYFFGMEVDVQDNNGDLANINHYDFSEGKWQFEIFTDTGHIPAESDLLPYRTIKVNVESSDYATYADNADKLDGRHATSSLVVGDDTNIPTSKAVADHVGSNYLSLKGGTIEGSLGFNHNYISKPIADYRTMANEHVGAITITLPSTTGGGNEDSMISFWVDVYNYVTDTSFSVHINGYLYLQTWSYAPTATVYGANHKVRYGHNGSSFVVYIGEVDSVWNHPQITVRDVMIGYQTGSYSKLMTGWTISFSTSFSNVTAEKNDYVWTTRNDGAGSGLDADLLDGKQGSYYLDYDNLSNTPSISVSDSTDHSTHPFVGDITSEGHTITVTRKSLADVGLSTVYKYKGTKTWAELKAIASAEIGDVYSITDKDPDGNTNADWACYTKVTAATGDNYASYWQSLGGKVDLAAYVQGPASSTANAIARYDGTTGKIIKDSAITIDDSGSVVPVTTATSELGSSSKIWKRAYVHQLDLYRELGVEYGRISFYKPTMYTWFEYMNPSGTKSPTGANTITYGEVTSWARRSLIEPNTGYGWIWEAASNTANADPVGIMALSSTTGNLKVKGSITAASIKKTDGADTHVLLAGGGTKAISEIVSAGGASVDLSNYIQGSGTANCFPKFTAERTIGDSNISYLSTGEVLIHRNVGGSDAEVSLKLRSNHNDSLIHFADKDNKRLGYFGFINKDLGYYKDNGSGGLTSAKIWHSENDGSDSGLDADKLDGKHASEFALKTEITSDTKNTAGSTNSDSKLFLVGTTSQTTYAQTYSDSEVYTTNGTLTTAKTQIGGGAVTMEYDSSYKALKFVFA